MTGFTIAALLLFATLQYYYGRRHLDNGVWVHLTFRDGTVELVPTRETRWDTLTCALLIGSGVGGVIAMGAQVNDLGPLLMALIFFLASGLFICFSALCFMLSEPTHNNYVEKGFYSCWYGIDSRNECYAYRRSKDWRKVHRMLRMMHTK